MIPTTHGAWADTGDIPITEDPTGPDTITAGILDTIMVQEVTTPNPGIVMDI